MLKHRGMIDPAARPLAQAKRIVVKIGSALVVDDATAAPRTAWLASVAADVAALREQGAQVILVSSGAIALARRALGLTRRKLRLEEKQAAAAVGQIRLAGAWQEALAAVQRTQAAGRMSPPRPESPRCCPSPGSPR
jgi:glutamate 5-kinase